MTGKKTDIISEYKKVGDPSVKDKARNWGIAIGLQAVDGLTPSKYLYQIARDNIEGKITSAKAEQIVATYYKQNSPKTAKEYAQREADEVAARINKLLESNTFSFSPAEYLSIHKYLFSGILNHKIVGKFRKYDITKPEAVLNGDTVIYGRSDSISETLDYDFKQEKKFDYKGLSQDEIVRHIAKFVSDIWQIHAFGEGNTRTTAVFAIKYLRLLGFKTANNELFDKNSLYFRNALVRANYQDLKNGVSYTMEYLNRFFGNLLLGEHNKLNNADLQIKKGSKKSSKKPAKSSKKSSEKIRDLILSNPNITLQKMADIIGLSVAGVRKNIEKLKRSGLQRVGGDKGGRWEFKK
jgi:fido (protein-threonine AMPylation protein)